MARLPSLGLLALTLLLGCEDEQPACEGPSCNAGGQGGGTARPCPDSGVLYGPWSLHFDETSAVVRWDGCKPSSTELSVQPESGGATLSFSGEQTAAEVTTRCDALSGIPPDLPGTYYRTEVAVTGLQSGACYRYEIGAEPARSGRFCTARAPDEPFRFMAIGDTNPAIGDTDDLLAAVLVENPDFVIHSGDIQLYASVFETWAGWFPQMAPLLEQGAFMPAIGNHEYENDTEFEDYYVRLFGGAGFDGTIDYYSFQSGGVWFFSLNTEIPLEAGSTQADWLEQQLADAAAEPGYRFSVVYLHRPFITLADYSQNTTEREHFRPIFLQRGVRVVLQGHVHGYERFVDGELTYITTGGGGAALHDLDERMDDRPDEAALRVASAKRNHAVVFEVGAGELTGTVISNKAEVLDTFVIGLQ
ncbi:MAG: metallophosphoesterase [Deltaproteobacteria bacterium]|nr:metallophosphoesterase [Deltaproteobacteria bacterium]